MTLSQINWIEPVELTNAEGVPEQYHQFESKSASAIRAAIGARRPLLVRGQPGVGKTQLAHAAAKLLKRPIVQIVVDSRTESRDLMWNYDPVKRLADAQLEAAIAAVRQSSENSTAGTTKSHDTRREEIKAALRPSNYIQPGPLWWAFDWEGAQRQADISGCDHETYQEPANPRNGVVMLIDEIDKAESDVPNGLLEALGSNRFRPFGFHEDILTQGESPLVVITTNEERSLPDAFVRRCVVLQLALPTEPKELEELLVERGKIHFKTQASSQPKIFEKAAEMLVKDRTRANELRRMPLPGQAEYLDLLRAVFSWSETNETKSLELLNELREFTLRKNLDPS
ncbi:MAG: AAA family ATPase [Planctomycetota bacterium]